MRKLSQFEKIGLVAAVIVACTFFYMKRVYEPQEKKLKSTVQRLNKMVNEINNLKSVPPAITVKNQLERRKDELARLEEQLRETTVLTGADREVTKLLNRITDVIEDKELAVIALVPKGKIDDGLFQWNLFEITMEGDFYYFIGFLSALREMPDAVRIEKAELSQKDGHDLSIRIELMI